MAAPSLTRSAKPRHLLSVRGSWSVLLPWSPPLLARGTRDGDDVKAIRGWSGDDRQSLSMMPSSSDLGVHRWPPPQNAIVQLQANHLQTNAPRIHVGSSLQTTRHG